MTSVVTASSDLSLRVKALALALGFDRVGIASPEEGSDTRRFRDWIAAGHAGEMGFLERRCEERVDPSLLMPGIRSVVVLGFLYDPPASTQDGPVAPEPARGRVASFAGGEDYHDVLLDRVHAVAAGIAAIHAAPIETRCYVDTGPVLERVFAARAGLGWQGKNTCLIDPRLGSRMLLAVVLSDLELAFDAPMDDHCGTCRACLDACPTDAFAEPYVLDARRCISYTTIETKGPIPEPLRDAHADLLFGCDICQDVCPWNRRTEPGEHADPLGLRARLEPDPKWVRAELSWVLSLDEVAWQSATRGTALRRPRWRGLLRNALVAAGNSGDTTLRAAIEQHAHGADPLLAEHARWALAKLDP
jgi:epoxyqueuosine reductase